MERVQVFSKISNAPIIIGVGKYGHIETSRQNSPILCWSDSGWNNSFDNWLDDGWNNSFDSWTDEGWNNSFDSWTDDGWNNW